MAPEDSILTVLAMFNTLQGRQALFEQSHGALRDTLPEPMFRFLSAAGSEWETPVVGKPIDAAADSRRRSVRSPYNAHGATEARKHGESSGSEFDRKTAPCFRASVLSVIGS